jgi:hypothetical protein
VPSKQPAGYSGTPLAKKLGLTEGRSIATIDAPPEYSELLAPLPFGARITNRMPATPELVHLFTTKRAHLKKQLEKLRSRISHDGTVWVSWPKKAANVPTDITEDVIREVGLPLGYVDVKVCAVDETWSGLKLVIRKELRDKSH